MKQNAQKSTWKILNVQKLLHKTQREKENNLANLI